LDDRERTYRRKKKYPERDPEMGRSAFPGTFRRKGGQRATASNREREKEVRELKFLQEGKGRTAKEHK